jgi:hypothetical protein
MHRSSWWFGYLKLKAGYQQKQSWLQREEYWIFKQNGIKIQTAK